MSSVLVDVAEAVRTSLNATVFSQAFTATREYAPERDLEALVTLTVTVIPLAQRYERGTRAKSVVEYDVAVGVQKKLTDETEIDGLVTLAEEIADHLRFRVQADVAWLRLANEPVVSPEHLIEKRVFTSLITATYQTLR